MNISQYIINAKVIITELELMTAHGTILKHAELLNKSSQLIKETNNIHNEIDRICNGYSQ